MTTDLATGFLGVMIGLRLTGDCTGMIEVCGCRKVDKLMGLMGLGQIRGALMAARGNATLTGDIAIGI